MNASNSVVEVWLDCDFYPAQKIGMLHHDRGQIRFHYDAAWIKQPAAFMIDPQLTLDEGAFFPKPETGNFGILMDSAPDRWGQTLMKRREALVAKDDKRAVRTLYAWDYLLGVQDATRQGALRFKFPEFENFAADELLSAPPVTNLPELATIAKALSGKNVDDLDKLRKWLAVLVAPGASLGGARPKANFSEKDGTLWIAKFPAHDDVLDVGAWEWLAWRLAKRADVAVPQAKKIRLGRSRFHTFCVQRFDRVKRRRRFYASAMTLLGKDVSEGTSYLEMAAFIASHGDPASIKSDLTQLFRRVIFNVAVGNRDDHLRNHGFLLTANGWCLSPAFDVNPNINKADHVLNLDESDNRPSIESAFATHADYGLDARQAMTIVGDVTRVVATWKKEALKAGISRGDIDLMRSAFSAVEVFKQPGHPDEHKKQ